MLAYCDYIADRIRQRIKGDILLGDDYMSTVGSVQWDLHPEEGYFVSTKKTLMVTDKNGKEYRITVEEV